MAVPPRIAVIGCGGIGRAHARAYAAAGVPAVAFVDPLLVTARDLAAQYGGHAYADMRDLPSDITVASVTTPPQGHYAVCRRLLEAGCHVWCEKPLAMDVAEAEELVRLAARQRRQLLVGFKYRYEAVFRAARAQLPRLGRLLAASCVKAQSYPRKPVDWVAQVGVLYELSIHDIDLLNWYLLPDSGGEPAGDAMPTDPRARPEAPNVLAAHLPHRFGLEREDQCFLTLGYPGGVTAQVAGIYSRDTKFLGRDVLLTVVGERGFLRVERPDRITVHLDDYEQIPVPPADAEPFTLEARNLLTAVTTGACVEANGWDGYLATAVIENARTWASTAATPVGSLPLRPHH